MVCWTPKINSSIEPISTSFDTYFSKPQHDNIYIYNTMSIVIEFIANTNYEIQIWIIKTCGKIYTHKTKEHRILEAQKIRGLKMLKLERQIKTQNWVFF
jgi:hypothetical protein